MQRAMIKTLLALFLVLALSIPTLVPATTEAQTGPYIIANQAVYVRGGPGIGFWILGTLYPGEAAPVLGVSADGAWWLVNTTFGEGWIAGYMVTPYGTDAVGVVDPGIIGTVTSGALNVRYGAGINAQSIGTLGRGDQIFVLARNTEGTWLQIRWGYGTGWVSAAHVNVHGGTPAIANGAATDSGGGVPLTSDTPYGIVLSAYLNVRTGPGPNFAIIGQATNGDTLPIVGRTSDSSWYQVESPFGTGWVYGAYIATRNEYGGSPVTTSDAAGAAIAGPFGIINTGALHIRSGPGPNYTSLGTLAGGTETQIVGRNMDWSWYLLKTPVGTGWASALYIITRGDLTGLSYVEPGTGVQARPLNGQGGGPAVDTAASGAGQAPVPVVAAPEAVVITGALNIRSGPNSSFPSLGSVYGGTRMPIIGQSVDRGWWQVQSEFGVGWVSKLYVLVDGDISNIGVTQ